MAAWDGLFSTARGLDLQPGQTILINGAAGGIGGVATQLARWRGARVIGTASAGNLDLVRDLGAEPRDYAAADWLDGLGESDGVLDRAEGEWDGRRGGRECDSPGSYRWGREQS